MAPHFELMLPENGAETMNSAAYSSDEETSSNMPGLAVRVLGGLAIATVFFFGTLFVLDYFYLPYPDYVRANDVRAIKQAMENYRIKNGSYPNPYPANPLADLKKDLVGGGYITAIPADPVYGPDPRRGYLIAANKSAYGMIVHLKYSAGNIPADGICMTGVNFSGVGWWGNPPPCPF